VAGCGVGADCMVRIDPPHHYETIRAGSHGRCRIGLADPTDGISTSAQSGLLGREGDAPHGQELAERRAGHVPFAINQDSVATVPIQYLTPIDGD
jgi:hypothetical protein